MKKRDINPFGLRLAPDLRERVEDQAGKHRHSLNTEIEMLIEDGLRWRESQEKQAVA
ncbi:Arc family DNA-binding protein [Aquipseudomonas alcaligenes]|uniref:Arc-like DNA binding domain-containing protein n=1 Tax=Aquipseudomonas alcaligenes (strain ATCC 14909 / DSM 50342 / CCUG 1425 / JCM 20561 / NBRC 14159 / NCIMB 9945 / NCTC 10367 / 1577) TaxID=1215092 RepID=U2Z4F7_AQUA1|nr:Arc family DNA-binding protein [Pseudomonas alcaligenes]GAD62646.1 hypothetical protein PA6_014_00190 [Pseudomonas alcaligenes NBRC 14159]SUD18187.1 Uncharacterised protein [Pseudomonas alcaligenes]